MAAGLYLPMRRAEYFNLALRTTGDARRLDGPLRKALNNLDPSIQVREIRPLEDVGYEDRAAFAVIGAALAALGGMALLLSVVGTYAILSLSVTEERFEPVDLPEDAFAHSLGVNQGAPERIEIAFEPRIARYLKERVWHPSQQLQETADGTLTMTLNVCNDWALRSWILGFGPLARVVSPGELATQILDEIEQTRSHYVPGLDFELPAGE